MKERLSDYQLYDKRVRIISNLHSDSDGLPSDEDSKELDALEIRIVDAVLANNEKDFTLGGYVTGGGKKEIFLYAKDVAVLTKLFKELQAELPKYTLKLDTQVDKGWNYYNAFCEERILPSAY